MEDLEKIEHVTFKQVVDAFVGEIIPAMKSGEWIDVNIIFNDRGYDLIDDAASDNEYRTRHLRQDVADYVRAISGSIDDDIEVLNSDTIKKNLELQNMSDEEVNEKLGDLLDDDTIGKFSVNIKVDNAAIFFTCLRDFVNKTLDLYRDYGETDLLTWSIMQDLLANVWLRMGINDVENPIPFLKKQIDFTKNRKLDIMHPTKISTYSGYDVIMYTKPNKYFDETSRTMFFKLTKKDETTGRILEDYTLPKVLYDIDKNDICYIYGVQNVLPRDKHDTNEKKIKRELYKLNKGVENPTVHPSKVLALMLFINHLRNNGITNVTVPSMQVLSYMYHEVLSRTSDEELKKADKDFDMNSESAHASDKLKTANLNYDRFYNKQDIISYLKTEELFNLVNRIVEHTPGMEITNEMNLQGDSINIRL